MILPQSIDEYTGSQRVVGGNEPLGQSLAALSLRSVGCQRISLRGVRQCAHTCRYNLFAFVLCVAALEHALLPFRLFKVTDMHRSRGRQFRGSALNVGLRAVVVI